MHVSRICSDLVAIRSENPPDCTSDCIEYICSFLDGLGIQSRVIGTPDGQDNLVTTGPVHDLLLCGHVDVVPALGTGWKNDPFSGLIDDQYVYGRGSTDMKGGCAAILSACEMFVNAGTELPATLAFVCDEETGGENGIRRLLADNTLSRPCDCIIAEPTPARHPNIGQKGLCRMDIQFQGTPAHGSLYPAVGVSAIMEAVALLDYVKALHDREYPVSDELKEIILQSSAVLGEEFRIAGVSDILKKLTFNPGTINGGEKSNVVAQHCSLELELRIPWGCSIPDIIAGIAAHAPNGKISSLETHEPSITEPRSQIVTITCKEVERAFGGPVFPILQWAASDARHLRRAGFRVIEHGPGEISTLHAVNERVTVESLEKASAVYQGVMRAYAGKES